MQRERDPMRCIVSVEEGDGSQDGDSSRQVKWIKVCVSKGCAGDDSVTDFTGDLDEGMTDLKKTSQVITNIMKSRHHNCAKTCDHDVYRSVNCRLVVIECKCKPGPSTEVDLSKRQHHLEHRGSEARWIIVGACPMVDSCCPDKAGDGVNRAIVFQFSYASVLVNAVACRE